MVRGDVILAVLVANDDGDCIWLDDEVFGQSLCLLLSLSGRGLVRVSDCDEIRQFANSCLLRPPDGDGLLGGLPTLGLWSRPFRRHSDPSTALRLNERCRERPV